MNKLEIAPHMLYRAAKSYVTADDEFDYIQAILLAGSAMYICEPLLEEQGKPTQAMERAKRLIKLREAKPEMVNNRLEIEWGANPLSKEEKEGIRKDTRITDRAVYNALKHAGFKQRGRVVKTASDDLDMLHVLGEYQDFRAAAEEIILDAITDYTNLDFSGDFKPYNLPIEIRRVLNCTVLEDAFEEE
ncbi:hypothetical protein [Vibrio parahaemolyticus]|uniref:hypothetical protein n=1 Tax=Vibrio parahaemolyticus TaxID=670 RepID=UPI0022B59A2F|nr:hypothetical protein [Vibrio parahaemolyticus]MCZ6313869.1 hypothetical protein [Vibrio parahaemolyticus]